MDKSCMDGEKETFWLRFPNRPRLALVWLLALPNTPLPIILLPLIKDYALYARLHLLEPYMTTIWPPEDYYHFLRLQVLQYAPLLPNCCTGP